VASHVLERGEYPILGERQRPALEALYRCYTERAYEIGIFAVSFFDAAPTRIARDIDDRREHEVNAPSANLATDDGENALEQLRVPAAGESDGLREMRRAPRGIAV
jgi:hypothetical protein